MNRTAVSLMVALLLAGLVTWVAYKLTNTNDNQAVLVAARLITVGEQLMPSNTRWELRKSKDISSDQITSKSDLSKLSTQSAKQDIAAGTPIGTNLLQALEKKKEFRVPTDLPAGKHAMLFNIPTDFAQRSILRSGDLIDIFLTRPVPPESREWAKGQMISEVLLHNVKILMMKENLLENSAQGMPKSGKDEGFFSNLNRIPTGPTHGNSGQGLPVILEVTTKEAQIIELGKSAGRLSIVVSSENDPASIKDTHPYTTSQELGTKNSSDIQRYTIVRGARVQTIEVKRRD